MIAVVMNMAVFTDEKIELFDRQKRDTMFKMNQAHYHNKNELYFLKKGETKYLIEDEIFILGPGDMIFVPAGAFHKTDTIKNGIRERILLVFGNDFTGEGYQKYIDELSKDKFIRIRRDKLFLINDIMSKIELESIKKQADYTEMERLYLRELLILISRYRLLNVSSELSEIYSIIQNIVKYINENFSGELSLSYLSRKYAMSPSYLSKQFKSVTGIGLNEYINISKITAAAKLLSETKMSITEVSGLCGYNDSNYFSTVFKKYMGITPKKYSLENTHRQ